MTYPRFIEVHTPENGNGDYAQKNSRTCINVDSICMFYPDPTEEQGCLMSFIGSDGGSYQDVSESYEELKALISNAGASINKGDPRLDQTKPLTIDELKDMVGQPVWDSNTDTWLLVYEGDWTYTPDPDRVCVRVVNRYGCNKIWLSEKDLIAKPLYRMKRCRNDRRTETRPLWMRWRS